MHFFFFFFKSSLDLSCPLCDRVALGLPSWVLAVNDYSRPAFSHLRIVALYFHCNLGLSPGVLSQAAGWLWPEAVMRGILPAVLGKAPLLLKDELLKDEVL